MSNNCFHYSQTYEKAMQSTPIELFNKQLQQCLLNVANPHHHSETTAPNILANTRNQLYTQQIRPTNSSNIQSISNRVYVNPNYQKKQSVIHINPEKCGKGIYVNPKLIEMKSKLVQKLINQTSESVDFVEAVQKPDFTKVQNNLKSNSVYVKPELMKQLVLSSVNKDQREQKKATTSTYSQNRSYKMISKTKLVKCNTPIRKSASASFLSISKKKLIRNSPKTIISGQSITKFRKVLIPDRQKLSINHVQKSILPEVKGGVKSSPINKYKIDRTVISRGTKKTRQSTVTKYKLDRTASVRVIRRSRSNMVTKYKVDRTAILKGIKKSKSNIVSKYKFDRTSRRVLRIRSDVTRNNIRDRPSTIVIEGQSYNMSRNKLVKNPQTGSLLKRRRNSLVLRNEQFVITKNGKKLRRNTGKAQTLSTKRNTSIKSASNKNIRSTTLPKHSQMKYLSTNARQRSLQLMQSNFRKNNQPCLVFRKYGYCPKQEKGMCSKVHNKKQVALCQKFLQGKCMSDNCKLSHDVGPEKMPTCKYFLKACCVRDSCPYRHVKVSDNTPICIQFLEGYCEKGNECKDRHIFLCPEFEKKGSCSKGKNCPYPHKSPEFDKKRKRENARVCKKTKYEPPKTKNVAESQSEETCQRYYNDSHTQELAKKRIKLLKQVRALKETHNECSNELENDNDSDSDIYVDTDDDIIVESVRVKKVPLGTLPSFIPIS